MQEKLNHRPNTWIQICSNQNHGKVSLAKKNGKKQVNRTFYFSVNSLQRWVNIKQMKRYRHKRTNKLQLHEMNLKALWISSNS